MSSLAEIQEAIEKLGPEERAEFCFKKPKKAMN